jgi:hypothetical protein
VRSSSCRLAEVACVRRARKKAEARVSLSVKGSQLRRYKP